MVSIAFDETRILNQASAAGIDIQRIRENIRAQEESGVLKRNPDGSLEVVPLTSAKRPCMIAERRAA